MNMTTNNQCNYQWMPVGVGGPELEQGLELVLCANGKYITDFFNN